MKEKYLLVQNFLDKEKYLHVENFRDEEKISLCEKVP